MPGRREPNCPLRHSAVGVEAQLRPDAHMTDFNELIPSMRDWNNGRGIEVEAWVGCSGNFQLAIGYSTIFWPRFVEFEDYVLREGFSIEILRGCEQQCGSDRQGVEAVMNHLHIEDIQLLRLRGHYPRESRLSGARFARDLRSQARLAVPAAAVRGPLRRFPPRRSDGLSDHFLPSPGSGLAPSTWRRHSARRTRRTRSVGEREA